MSDGFEDGPGADLSSDYGFVGQDGWERTPGNGWESEPICRRVQTRMTWRDRVRFAFLRIIRR